LDKISNKLQITTLQEKLRKTFARGNSGLMIMDYQNNAFRDGVAKKEFVRLKQIHNWRNCTK